MVGLKLSHEEAIGIQALEKYCMALFCIIGFLLRVLTLASKSSWLAVISLVVTFALLSTAPCCVFIGCPQPEIEFHIGHHIVVDLSPMKVAVSCHALQTSMPGYLADAYGKSRQYNG